MHGTMRDFVQLFPWAVSVILLVSLLVAELVVPFLQFYFIREPMKSRQGKHRSFLDIIQASYDWLVDRCFRCPYITIGVGLVSIVLGVFVISRLPQRLMPTAERNQFAVEIYLPTGSSLHETAALADSLEHILRADERVVSIASFKGMASPRFQAGYAPQFASTNYAQFIVNTQSNKATNEVIEKYRPKYENAFPGAYLRFKQLAYGIDENPVEVRLTGDNWMLLRQAADSVTGVLRRNSSLRLVRNNVLEPMSATAITLDPIRASRFGINNISAESTMAMRYNSSGLPLAAIWQGDYDVNICLKGNHASDATLSNVADELMPVYGGIATVPLRQVAKVQTMWLNGQIPHRNGLRCITIMADVAQGENATAVNKKIKQQLTGSPLPDGVSLSFGGEMESNEENMPTLVGALAVAIVIIFFILLSHFRRISTAMLLLVSLSLCLFGTAVGVWVTGVDFSLTCFLGIISLMGILVRNAIIMYDYAEELRQTESMTAHDAIYTSAKRRMRPIFLTSAAASMGVMPMILGGSGLWMPMGAVICFGTLITMIFILTILPIGYWLTMSGTTKRRLANETLEQQ